MDGSFEISLIFTFLFNFEFLFRFVPRSVRKSVIGVSYRIVWAEDMKRLHVWRQRQFRTTTLNLEAPDKAYKLQVTTGQCQCLSGMMDPSESASRSTGWNNKVALAQNGAGACATQRDSIDGR